MGTIARRQVLKEAAEIRANVKAVEQTLLVWQCQRELAFGRMMSWLRLSTL
eukprot:CAMPEP_0119337806 /NCGR_PEP_ID=MMETSP1333-20130426/94750_1 /TAXON_ID=418940 /ORGANISM="Scyphosphaera apsteinii, Strain RCC1455" /LENGTH=50 /DNA_ID=CAMNT_0007348939 /DNA_START=64 /DNA_END=212 /DNA_ORIENTATION=+